MSGYSYRKTEDFLGYQADGGYPPLHRHLHQAGAKLAGSSQTPHYPFLGYLLRSHGHHIMVCIGNQRRYEPFPVADRTSDLET